VNYYTSDVISSSLDIYNRNATIQLLTGDRIEVKFYDYFNYKEAIKKGDIKILHESENAFDIFDDLECNNLRSYNLLFVVDKDDINAIIECSENGFTRIVLQFCFCVINILAIKDKKEFENEIDSILEPFYFPNYIDEIKSNIRAYGIMMLIQANPECWESLSVLLSKKVRFEFFED
jgi:hypothetical protein